jgi:hypothetical protein
MTITSEPFHLLIKWSARQEPETLEIHRQLALVNGEVWWGKFGRGMSYKRLAGVRRQLDSAIETHVYLYRKGECWRTTLADITTDERRVERDRIPTYYRTSLCSVFVLLRDFFPLPNDWIQSHLAPLSSPEQSRMSGALANQSTLIYVVERSHREGPTAPV